jgi:AcrR family transcriptional regulator
MAALDGPAGGVHPRRVPRATRSPKHSYHHGDLRRALLDAALQVLEAEGAHALTLREVARRVGVTQAAPYHHFSDKEAILAAVAEEGFVKLYEAMSGSRDAAGVRPAPRLRALGKGYVDFAVRHPAHFRVMFGRLVDIPKYPSLHAAAQLAFAALVESIVEAQKAGVTRRGNPAELAILAWSTMHGLSMLWVECAAQGPAGPEVTIETLTDGAADMLIRGLAR